MSNKDQTENVIHTEKLIIHAKEVEVIQDVQTKSEQHHTPSARRDPWAFFWGRRKENVETDTDIEIDLNLDKVVNDEELT